MGFVFFFLMTGLIVPFLPPHAFAEVSGTRNDMVAGSELIQICHENGGVWKSTRFGQRGCLCPNGQYLINVYFDVCGSVSKTSRRRLLTDPSGGPKSEWAEKGASWGLSSRKRSLSSPREVVMEFVTDVNRGDIDSAMGLVNDHEVHPSREVAGIDELLRRFRKLDYRDWDFVIQKFYSAIAEPNEEFSGCLYLEESVTTIVNGLDTSRGLGKMHIYCVDYSAKKMGRHPISQAKKLCLSYRPKKPNFVCKIGFFQMT
ncbi:MAG: hypothetical protein IPJ71_00195 [Bdellovibrionales bacterium]|nr:hypothetical protein [Bdellovibrionales bacterium]